MLSKRKASAGGAASDKTLPVIAVARSGVSRHIRSSMPNTAKKAPAPTNKRSPPTA